MHFWLLLCVVWVVVIRAIIVVTPQAMSWEAAEAMCWTPPFVISLICYGLVTRQYARIQNDLDGLE